MAHYRPVPANSIVELEKAVKESQAVIILTNKNLTDQIKKRVEKDSRFDDLSNKAIAGSPLGVIAGMGIGVIGSCFFAPLLIVGAALMSVSVMAGGYGSIAKVFSLLTRELRDYKYIENTDGKALILYKAKGKNAFDIEKDSIDY